MSNFGNGGWKPVFRHDSNDLCKDGKVYTPEWYNLILANSGYTDCPVPPVSLITNCLNYNQ